MGAAQTSLNGLLQQAVQQGVWFGVSSLMSTGITASSATSQCGYVPAGRSTSTITVPSISGGSGIIPVRVSATDRNGTTALLTICNEFLLGTLTVSGNSFASGSAMPTRTVSGTSLQLAASLVVLVVTTTLTATTPTVTITYTDQSGNTGKTASMVLPTNSSATTSFIVTPHLASGTSGVRAVTAMSISTGSAGVLKAYGLMAIGNAFQASGSFGDAPINTLSAPTVPLQAADAIACHLWDLNSGISAPEIHAWGVLDS